ncbi:hypothetical protein GIB67_021006 [Kingdonia uniflora]|uniref:Uncharacterized protein n=1 Tax=Kingdonia uniflora TaxID=39325 RepID=A0A7J7N6U1_9MAGN|nr:hypothetical protein GIB67_021006 [Kingdonia uniflora]
MFGISVAIYFLVENNELADVDVVSAGNNYEVGQMIAEAMSKVGRKGIMTLEEGKSLENSLYVAEGMQFVRGYIFPYFVTKITSCWQLDHKRKGSHRRFGRSYQGRIPILIIVEDIEQEAPTTLVINQLRGALKITTLKASKFGERKSQYLDDIAILTGAIVIREKVGLSLDKAEKEVLGHVAKVVLTEEVTTIVGNGSIQDAVNKSCRALNERIGKLSGGVAVILSCFNNGDLKFEKMGTDVIIVGAGVALAHTLGKKICHYNWRRLWEYHTFFYHFQSEHHPMKNMNLRSHSCMVRDQDVLEALDLHGAVLELQKQMALEKNQRLEDQCVHAQALQTERDKRRKALDQLSQAHQKEMERLRRTQDRLTQLAKHLCHWLEVNIAQEQFSTMINRERMNNECLDPDLEILIKPLDILV